MVDLYARPIGHETNGFSFSSMEEFEEGKESLGTLHGSSFEEFNISVSDEASSLEKELATAMGLDQTSMAEFFELAERGDDDMVRHIILCTEYPGKPQQGGDPRDIEIYYGRDLHDLAQDFVAEGMFREVSDGIIGYIDYESTAKDLGYGGYMEITIAGESIVYYLP